MSFSLFPDDSQFHFEALRALGHGAYGGAEAGEVFAVLGGIRAGDYDGWHDAWVAMADRVRVAADRARAADHPVSARDGYLRASNYYRSAEFFLHGDPHDPRIAAAYEASVSAFRSYVELVDGAIEPVEIPFEGTVLHGYLYRAAGEGPRPIVVMHNGFDGSVEEMHFFGAAAALERGYHVLSFDGPGQPAARHRDGLVFRPDWENVVTPVLDWLLAEHAGIVDPERIALLGISMGGILAPRAAAFEKRIAAVIAIDGVYDLGEAATGSMPMPREQAEQLLRAESVPELDAALEESMAQDPTARWAMTHGMYAMGVDSPRAFLASYLDYTLADGIAEQIGCPVLIADAEDDLFFAGQAEQLYAHVTAPKTLLRFTAEEGAGAHCHSGALRPALGRVYDWLDEVFAASTADASPAALAAAAA